MKRLQKNFYILLGCFFSMFEAASVFAYDFNEDSGLSDTAKGTGHTEMGATDIDSIISIIVNTVLSFLGVIFLLLMIYGGYLWMTAGGNEQQMEKSKKLIVESIIGLIVVVAAYAISWFVINQFGV